MFYLKLVGGITAAVAYCIERGALILEHYEKEQSRLDPVTLRNIYSDKVPFTNLKGLEALNSPSCVVPGCFNMDHAAAVTCNCPSKVTPNNPLFLCQSDLEVPHALSLCSNCVVACRSKMKFNDTHSLCPSEATPNDHCQSKATHNDISLCPSVMTPNDMSLCPSVVTPNDMSLCPSVVTPNDMSLCPSVVTPNDMSLCPSAMTPNNMSLCPSAVTPNDISLCPSAVTSNEILLSLYADYFVNRAISTRSFECDDSTSLMSNLGESTECEVVLDESHIDETRNNVIDSLFKVRPREWAVCVMGTLALDGFALTIVLIALLVVCCVACVYYRKRILCNRYTCKYFCSPEHCKRFQS